MEFWLLVWIFYVVLVAFTFVFVSYSIVKSDLKDRYSVPVLFTVIVLLSAFWPGTWLALLCTKVKKDYKDGDEDGDY